MASHSPLAKIAQKLSYLPDEYNVNNSITKGQHRYNIFGFYSPFDNTGQTTAIINAAALLGAKNKTVCVVDLNFLCPDVFRFLQPTDKSISFKSVKDILVNSTLPVTEIVNRSRLKNVVYISSDFSDMPSVYCGGATDDSAKLKELFSSMFASLSVIYDYVLNDIAPDITLIETISAFAAADTMFTFLDGTMRSIEFIMKYSQLFSAIGIDGLFNNLIQSRLRNVCWSGEDLRKVSPDTNLIMNIPYSDAVSAISASYDVFCAKNKSIEPEANRAKECIHYLCSQIIESSKIGEVAKPIILHGTVKKSTPINPTPAQQPDTNLLVLTAVKKPKLVHGKIIIPAMENTDFVFDEPSETPQEPIITEFCGFEIVRETVSSETAPDGLRLVPTVKIKDKKVVAETAPATVGKESV